MVKLQCRKRKTVVASLDPLVSRLWGVFVGIMCVGQGWTMCSADAGASGTYGCHGHQLRLPPCLRYERLLSRESIVVWSSRFYYFSWT